MVRAAIQPADRQWPGWPDVTEGEAGEGEALSVWLRNVCADPMVREALMISSSSLSRSLDLVCAGETLDSRDLRRMVSAVTRYLLRMRSRATPFGLLAGAAVGTFEQETPAALWGSAHRKGVRPDMGWLREQVARYERRVEVLRGLRVVANNLCFVRANRLVLPYVPASEDNSSPGRRAGELSVRFSAPVRLVVTRAACPVEFARVAQELHEQFPAAPVWAAEVMLCELVACEVLLTELRPPPEEADPLGFVLERLATVPHLAEIADLTADVEELRKIQARLTAYAALPLGAGAKQLREVTGRMQRLHSTDRVVQVDLALDLTVALPGVVAAEAEHAAQALYQVISGPAGHTELSGYHADFVERYGVGVAVPIKEVLDPDIGLGAPAGYQVPPSSRPAQRSHGAEATARDRLLGTLVQEATFEANQEIVLDDTLLARLADVSDATVIDVTGPPSVELCAHLLAESVPAMTAGDFRLVVTGALASVSTIAMFGRFGYLLNTKDRGRIADLAQSAPTGNADAVPAQLSLSPCHARVANVIQVPRWLEYIIPVGTFADPSDERILTPDDLAVCADWNRLYLMARSLDREVIPTVFHSLNFHSHAPNIARLLQEIAHTGVRMRQAWSWGAADALPYLPRVRYGRTVLSSARWSVDHTSLFHSRTPFEEWRNCFDHWRQRWRVPNAVYLTGVGDQRIALDLTAGQHLRLLRQDLARRGRVTLLELPAGGKYGTEWLGGHVNEVVFPLSASADNAGNPNRPSRAATLMHGMGVAHLPGGRWLYVKVYCSPARHDDLLVNHLPSLLGKLANDVDWWWFVRYLDPQPHLRLRFHSKPNAIGGQLLSILHDRIDILREAGLASHFQVDTYVPEVGRYGGSDAIMAAERVFCADSQAVLTQLAWLRAGGADFDPSAVAAANHVDMTCQFFCGIGAGMAWLAGNRQTTVSRSASAPQRRDATRLIDPHRWSALRASPGGQDVLQSWAHRGAAIAKYRDSLDITGSHTPRDDILNSLLHMHHNRLVGVNLESEQRCVALTRSATRTYQLLSEKPAID
ncbi:MAG: lantibiotic dehydratase [Pseudonocardiaceae bacterium]